MPTKPILLVDDEQALCRMMSAILTDRGYSVVTFTNPLEAVSTFSSGHYSAVITDIKMPGMDGLEVLARIKAKDALIPIIIITAHATVDLSIQALRCGAYDMLTKPFEPEELLSRLRNALRQTELVEENQSLKQQIANQFGALIGHSPNLLSVLDTARKVASRDIPVLIMGESGTGKELVASAIHEHSSRRDKRFLAINCGAIPETLLESELFGHRKGAFTGADREHIGLVESADGGTLFLDEIGNLPLTVQKTLLRFLQEQEFYRVGDTTPRKVNVRILSATNADLQAAVQQGQFRDDLFYRLNVVTLKLPPLRERRSDIPLLVTHFITQQNARFGTDVKGLTPQAMRALVTYDWPGNVRQLSNVIQAALAIDNNDYIDLATLAQFIDLPVQYLDNHHTSNPTDSASLDYAAALARFEMEYLNQLLHKTGGVIEEVAHQAGMNVATIYRKMKKYGLRGHSSHPLDSPAGLSSAD